MARELEAIAELPTAEMIMTAKDLTLGFDATTQEDIRINNIHFTNEMECLAAAVDEVPRGFADDYAMQLRNAI